MMFYGWLVVVAVVLVLGGEWHGHRRGVEATEVRYAAQAAEAQQENRKLERQLAMRNQEITDAYIKAKNAAVADAAAVRGELLGLRHALAQRGGGAGDAGAAGGTPRARERELLEECAGALADVGGEADRIAGKLTALQAWVRSTCLVSSSRRGAGEAPRPPEPAH